MSSAITKWGTSQSHVASRFFNQDTLSAISVNFNLLNIKGIYIHKSQIVLPNILEYHMVCLLTTEKTIILLNLGYKVNMLIALLHRSLLLGAAGLQTAMPGLLIYKDVRGNTARSLYCLCSSDYATLLRLTR